MNRHFASCCCIMILSLGLSGCEPSVLEKARSFTVRVTTKNKKSATGIIFARNNNRYKILMNMHIAKDYIKLSNDNIPSPSELEKKIISNKTSRDINAITSDNREHEMFDCRPISKDNEMDLAICDFESNVNYEIATFSKEIPSQKQVYLLGYKGCYIENQQNQHYEEFRSGEIISDENKGKAKKNKWIKKFTPPDKPKEYDTYYTNASIGGMSGAPLLNNKAEVIAVHGKAGNNRGNIEDAMLQSCKSLSGEFENNWGISTKNFIDFVK